MCVIRVCLSAQNYDFVRIYFVLSVQLQKNLLKLRFKYSLPANAGKSSSVAKYL